MNYCEKHGAGPVQHREARLDQAPDGLRQVRWSTTTASGPRASSSAATHVYSDGKLYDCPAPCLGISITTSEPVWNDLKQKYPATLTLAVGGATIYLTLGVFLGALAARWRGSSADRLLVGSHAGGLLDPVLRDRAAGVDLPLAPAQDLPEHRVLPDHREPREDGQLHDAAVAGDRADQLHATTPGSPAARWWRPSTRTTCARRRPRACRRVTGSFKHALRAAIVPVITIFGLDFATLLGGTIFTEQIFSIDGIGHWGLQALHDPIDINVISATVLVAAVLIVVANLIVDVVYGFLDPRVTVG